MRKRKGQAAAWSEERKEGGQSEDQGETRGCFGVSLSMLPSRSSWEFIPNLVWAASISLTSAGQLGFIPGNRQRPTWTWVNLVSVPPQQRTAGLEQLLEFGSGTCSLKILHRVLSFHRRNRKSNRLFTSRVPPFDQNLYGSCGSFDGI